MSERRLKLNQTQEIPAWRVALTKLGRVGARTRRRRLLGWEYAPPEKGYPYLVYLKDRSVLRTSPIQEVRETDQGLIVRTLRSIYRVEYLGTGCFTEDPIG